MVDREGTEEVEEETTADVVAEEVVEAEEETLTLTMRVLKKSLTNLKEVEEAEVVEEEVIEVTEVVEVEEKEEIEVIEVVEEEEKEEIEVQDLRLLQGKSKLVEKKLAPEEADLKAQELMLSKLMNKSELVKKPYDYTTTLYELMIKINKLQIIKLAQVFSGALLFL